MMKIFGLPLSVAAALLMIGSPSGSRAYSQQSGGVFVGNGRVARPGPRNERARNERAPDEREANDREASGRDYGEDELKPMIGGRALLEVETLEQQCLDEVNRQREARGLPPLKFSEDLLEVARYYSRRMAEEGFFSHSDPQGRTVRQRVSEAGIRWRVVGENLAYSNGYTNPVAVSMHGWMGSPGHRRNILDPEYRQTAIGAWIGPNGTVYFTEIFLKQ